MAKISFNEVFIGWILAYVSSVSFEVLVNRGKSALFRPSRGPSVFLSIHHWARGFLKATQKEFADRNIDGVKASIRAPPITHVMYAYDIVLFSKATTSNAATITNCINKYCDWSGQNLNTSKYGVFFSKHTLQSSRRVVTYILQMKSLKKDAIYLGSPLFLSRSPSKDFKYLIDKLETRLMGWRSKTLSWAGRSTLITSVA